MPEIRVEIKNLQQIRTAFARFPETIAPYLRKASMKSAFLIERRAKELSPVDTGRMRGSIATSLGVLNKGISSVVQTNVFYAVWVHEGTRRLRGRPFMKQAAEQNRQNIQNIYDDEVKNAMQEVADMAK